MTTREKIIDAIRQGARTSKEIQKATGMVVATISRNLKAMADEGEVTRVQVGQATPSGFGRGMVCRMVWTYTLKETP